MTTVLLCVACVALGGMASAYLTNGVRQSSHERVWAIEEQLQAERERGREKDIALQAEQAKVHELERIIAASLSRMGLVQFELGPRNCDLTVPELHTKENKHARKR
jgi:hypothetical protein